jgi:acetoin utilization protein AcuB
MTVGMVMTRPIIGLPPTASLPEAAQAMVREKIGSLAVLEGGRLIGLLTETDLLAALVEMLDSTEPSPEVPEALRRAAGIALDAMSFPLVTVPPTATLAEALSLMGGRDIRHLPVTEGGRLVGVLSDRDIRTAMGREAVTAGVFAGHPPAGGRPVSELMNPPLHVLSAPATLADAARTMLLHRISALPVVAADDPSRPVGILTETDLLVALVGMTG